MEKSLVLIKPDAVENNVIGKIISCYENAGIKIKALKLLTATEELASRHYEEHKGKSFYDTLIKYITRGPLCALIVEGDGVIDKVRKINGSTNPKTAEIGTIRKMYAKSITENCVHASDGEESAKREIAIWFPDEINKE